MGLSAVEKDHNYCRVPIGSSECDSTLGVPQFSGQGRLETFPGSICKNLSEIRYSQYRPFCILDVSSTPNLHSMETRSEKSGNQCHVSTMGKNVPISLSTMQPNTLGTVEAKERRDHNDIGGTNMAITSMIFSSSEHVYPQSNFIATSERPNSSSKPNSKRCGLVAFQKSLASKGISDKAAKLISDSRIEISIPSYESTWHQWSGWCGKRKVDPFRCPLKFVLGYLSDMFEKGLSYIAINVHRSAISAYHKPLHGFPIGQSPFFCSLLSDVFNHRPPQSRYIFIWDVEKVICYLKSLPALKDLSDKALTLKTDSYILMFRN